MSSGMGVLVESVGTVEDVGDGDRPLPRTNATSTRQVVATMISRDPVRGDATMSLRLVLCGGLVRVGGLLVESKAQINCALGGIGHETVFVFLKAPQLRNDRFVVLADLFGKQYQ